VLYELKGSSVVCPYENVSFPQKLIPYYLSSFPNDEECKWKHTKHPKYSKNEATWDEPIKMVQP